MELLYVATKTKIQMHFVNTHKPQELGAQKKQMYTTKKLFHRCLFLGIASGP